MCCPAKALSLSMQEEVRCLQREFNLEFSKLLAAKRKDLERLDDKCKRVEAIQKVWHPTNGP